MANHYSYYVYYKCTNGKTVFFIALPMVFSTLRKLCTWTFTSADGVDIRVGRTSSDNDEVSCNPECRDSKDWWMHAAGCPGSHVVIRYTGDEGPPRETVTDAALLAAVNSK